jgi:hypothetical protein
MKFILQKLVYLIQGALNRLLKIGTNVELHTDWAAVLLADTFFVC